ncbi:glycine/D-amino acid oxidase, deaminating [Bernardetia litoralis DSM 6794]|uniref:Glycine/D-amino acid oxidase, deaminating n=1 Tax=Bernardetia litoralis (strain ATCC 23117 / DSM 6794 / NBRC 15988 / NCIMB 1366 / Fx l1 / Sio-4) TaxID=880071 RepID=I4AEY6_BERLS|nr:FAD-dependent oxidoreductase [Bernardetia litoralis]AFM02521.1 glycine/D-amino acid oxidase, deaminating [Bernardetia litoralis DSM 6794]
MWSFWENKSFKKYDYIIVGAGITGLSTAASLIEKNPKAKIAILERGFLPTGASTKNAGFACFGSLSEIASDLDTMSETELQDLVSNRLQGLEKLRHRLGDKKIGYKEYGGYELILDKQIPYIEKLDKVNQLLQPIFEGKNVFKTKDGLIEGFGFNARHVRRIVYNRFEGQIHTGKMMKSLLNYVQKRGVTIFTGCEVIGFEDAETEGKNNVTVKIKNPLEDTTIELITSKLAVCTNAFSKKLIPDLDLEAGRGQVLVTKPFKYLRFKGTFHLDEGFYYFRNFGKRIILGGGRNMDFEGENTTKLETTELIIEDLKSKLSDIIIPKQKFEIDTTWAGIMAFTESSKTKTPLLQNYSKNVVLGVRLGGMGVALGSKLGDEIANLIEN